MSRNDNISTQNEMKHAGLFRRLFAIFYDCFLLAALLFIVSAMAIALNHGKAIEPGNTFYPLYIFILSFLCYMYFSWFWIHGGQTLGMKTWRLQLQSSNSSAIDWKTATVRMLFAIISWGFLGAGFLWSLVDSKNRCWHDMLSKTVLIDLRK